MPSTSVASCRANWRPMQARCPDPNGLYALGGRASRRCGSKWSGLKSSASGPQTSGSRCSIGVSAMIDCPGWNGPHPPTVVASRAWRVNAGAVGHSRSVSSRICRM